MESVRSSAWQRRSVSVTAVTLGLAALVPSMIVLVPVAAVYDLIRGRNFPTVRMLLFGVCYLAWELVAIVSSGALWVATGFGRWVDRTWSIRAHHRLQATWVDSLLRLAGSLLHLRLDVAGTEALSSGPLIVLCRHASMVDTLIPAKLLFDAGFHVRYVLKTELVWDPALDIIGHRLPNHFVDRSGSNTSTEVEALQRLAAGMGPKDALVIFPEGTRWTERKHERVVAKLRETDPPAADRAAQRRFTMPPRPAGTSAVLDGAPDADVVIVSYTGLENLAGPVEALGLVPFARPVTVDLRRIARWEVPPNGPDRSRWLDDRWDEVDAWIAEHHGE